MGGFCLRSGGPFWKLGPIFRGELLFNFEGVYVKYSGNNRLGGGNSNIFYFHPQKLGKMNPFWRIFFKWVETTNQIGVGNFSVHLQPSNQPVPLLVVTWQMLPRIWPQRPSPKSAPRKWFWRRCRYPNRRLACVFQFTELLLSIHERFWMTIFRGFRWGCFAPIRCLGWKNLKWLHPPEVQYDPVRFWKMDGIGRSLRLILFWRALLCNFSEFSEC